MWDGLHCLHGIQNNSIMLCVCVCMYAFKESDRRCVCVCMYVYVHTYVHVHIQRHVQSGHVLCCLHAGMQKIIWNLHKTRISSSFLLCSSCSCQKWIQEGTSIVPVGRLIYTAMCKQMYVWVFRMWVQMLVSRNDPGAHRERASSLSCNNHIAHEY